MKRFFEYIFGPNLFTLSDQVIIHILKGGWNREPSEQVIKSSEILENLRKCLKKTWKFGPEKAMNFPNCPFRYQSEERADRDVVMTWIWTHR
jgi:hypothetical protein